MECAKRGCNRTALKGSNYCDVHQPRTGATTTRLRTKKAVAARKMFKKKVAKKKA